MAREKSLGATFELAGTAPAGMDSEVLGLWIAGRSSTHAPISFAAGEEPSLDVPVWRVNLPGDSQQAIEALSSAESGLSRADQALDVAEQRISALVEKQTSPAVYDIPLQRQVLAPPEQELMALLNQAQYGKLAPSFGLADEIRDGWDKAVEQFQSFVALVVQTLTHYAWVETKIEDHLLVRTAVSWKGDFETAWQDQLDPERMALHQRTLNIALASRAVTLRTFAIVAAAAGKLSALMTAPGGAILALPAAWKYINEIRAELEKYQPLMEENPNGK